MTNAAILEASWNRPHIGRIDSIGFDRAQLSGFFWYRGNNEKRGVDVVGIICFGKIFGDLVIKPKPEELVAI